MLTPDRALSLNVESSPPMPRIEALRDLYAKGATPRVGETMMIAGRSGSQKSGFALWLCANWNLPTIYMSADMRAFTASTRLASSLTGKTTAEVERGMKAGGDERQLYMDELSKLQIRFSFGKPITWTALEEELDAEVELFNRFPKVIVIDNLMDVQAADSDYVAQMEAMSYLTELARDTGASVLILHHATDKGWDAKDSPWKPPSRDQIKNGLSEKPEQTWSVALDPNPHDGLNTYRVAILKQREGPSDPSGNLYTTLKADPARTQFFSYL